MHIKTASWFTKLPSDHIQVGISRGVPRGMPGGYKRYGALNPGPWFNSVPIPEYLTLYNVILAGLNPQRVATELTAIGGGRVPTLLCYEGLKCLDAGECWCHRHLVAQWLEDQLGITVEEFGRPQFDRWRQLRAAGIEPPSYR